MALGAGALRDLYRRRARWYDLTANLYYAIGFREQRYRRLAVDALGLRRGDTVVELCCGTGLNFALLEDRVGDRGKVIGVDMTDAMLERADARVRRRGWRNVDLVQAEVGSYVPPAGVNGVISTFALTLVPAFERVIRSACGALDRGGSFVVLDFKEPDRVPELLVRIGVAITRPFGVTRDLADRRPWEAMKTVFGHVDSRDFYFGFAYLARSHKPARGSS